MLINIYSNFDNSNYLLFKNMFKACKRAAIGNMYFINTTHLECKNSIECLLQAKKLFQFKSTSLLHLNRLP